MPRTPGQPQAVFAVKLEFEDGSVELLSLEQQAYQMLKHYARMLTSESIELQAKGDQELRKVAAVLAKAENARFLGMFLKRKQQMKNINDDARIYEFLSKQGSKLSTSILAERLRTSFGIESVRGSEDRVRAWKKTLRSAGGT